MDYITFGRTGLQVSAVGLGTGGASKIGMGTGADEQQAINVIHRALELGVTYFDTAKGYGTEGIVGEGLKGSREQIILSSKEAISDESGKLLTGAQMRDAIEDSLRQLQTESIDIYHLHHLAPKEYGYAVEEIYPVLATLRDEGKIGYLGVSESTSLDGEHQMLAKAAKDNYFDVMMTGFNFFNQSTRENLFPLTIKNDIAIEIMGSARGPYSNPELLKRETAKLLGSGELSTDEVDTTNPLGFLIGEGHAESLAEASYRMTRYEPGVHVVLVGTGNTKHLEDNITSIHKGPLPSSDLERAKELLGHLRVSRS